MLETQTHPVTARSASQETCELTILMPCLNEAETLDRCIVKARGYLARCGVAGEVLVADNGSTDGSQAIAEAAGARVVPIPERGYGSALIGGVRAARGRYVIMGDSDDSYDFSQLDLFVQQLRAGYQLVMGNRFKGGIMPGAMPPLHRYLGNPVLTAIGRIFFRSPCGDFHCGLRGFDRAAILSLDLQAPGMEFASEMVVKATIRKLRITEVPTTLSPDGRSRPPHLRSWRDGWRHLRFLLLFSPRWLFLYPGAALFVDWSAGHDLARATFAQSGERDTRHPHLVLRGTGRGRRRSLDAVLGVRQGLRHAGGLCAARPVVPADYADGDAGSRSDRRGPAAAARLGVGLTGTLKLGQRGIRSRLAGNDDAAGNPVRNRDPAGVPDRLWSVLPQRAGNSCKRTASQQVNFHARSPNAQYNVARPGSLPVRVAHYQRRNMYSRFVAAMRPCANDTILDIGVTSDRTYDHSNYLETWYPEKARITAAGIDEDARYLEQMYPGSRFVLADGRHLPFADGSFDFVHSSAVIEHVGSRARQVQFLRECFRVARKGMFITTPNRWFPIEFHTVLPLLHWLPPNLYRRVLTAVGKDFYAAEENLNLLSRNNLTQTARSAGIERMQIDTVALAGWPTNLLLVVNKEAPGQNLSRHAGEVEARKRRG